MTARGWVVEYRRTALGAWAPLTESTLRTGFVSRQVVHPSQDAALGSVSSWDPSRVRVVSTDRTPDYEMLR